MDFDKPQEVALMTNSTSRPDRWNGKGLGAGRMPVFLGYDQTDRMIAALLDRAAQWQPEAVVGIARAGWCRRPWRRASSPYPWKWSGSNVPPARAAPDRSAAIGPRILLVDDGAAPADAMAAVREALVREGRDCLTLAVVHDPEVTSFFPDLSHAMRMLWRFPWSAARRRRRGRALRATGAGPDRTDGSCRSTAWTLTASSCPTCPTSLPRGYRRCGRPAAPAGTVCLVALLRPRARGRDYRSAGFRS